MLKMGLKIALFTILRIDNGGFEYMCTCFYVFSDILAIHKSIWTPDISNWSWISKLSNGISYIIVGKGVQNICIKEN